MFLGFDVLLRWEVSGETVELGREDTEGLGSF
jgi:hypothetical protein